MSTSIYVVQFGENPSSDYFVRPYVETLAAPSITSFDLRTAPPIDLDPSCSVDVIFVRYINFPWRRWVERNRAFIRSVIVFIDDDVFDLKSLAEQSLRYRWKVFWLAGLHAKWLREQGVELLVSNATLARKYKDWNPRLLTARSPYTNESHEASLVFYHGTASHIQEFAWLEQVVRQVAARDPTVMFEIIGDRSVRDRFRDLHSVHVLHPMDWLTYKTFVGRSGRTIGLAPLFAGGMNDYRSPTKFFDITQAGAAGIYADHPVYAEWINDGVDGFLLPMEADLWVEKILALCADPELAASVVARARLRVDELQ